MDISDKRIVIDYIQKMDTEKRVVVQVNTLSDATEQFQQPVTYVTTANPKGYRYTDPLYQGPYPAEASANWRIVRIANTAQSLKFTDEVYGGSPGSYGNTFLSVASLGDNVTTLLSDAFLNCQSLGQVVASDNLKTVEDNCFRGCSNLSYASILDYRDQPLFKIGKHAFEGTALTAIQLKITGGLYDGVQVPSEVADYAFKDCTSLETVNFIQSNSIGNNVFEGCTSLRNVNLNNKYGYFGNETFRGCTALEYIKIPSLTHSIPFGTFVNCTSLKTVDFEDTDENRSTVTLLEDLFLSGCTSLTSITLPRSMNRWDDIEDYAFSGSSVKQIIFRGLSYEDLTETVVNSVEITSKYQLGHIYSTDFSYEGGIQMMRDVYNAGIPVVFIWTHCLCDNCITWHNSDDYRDLIQNIPTKKYLWINTWDRTEANIDDPYGRYLEPINRGLGWGLKIGDAAAHLPRIFVKWKKPDGTSIKVWADPEAAINSFKKNGDGSFKSITTLLSDYKGEITTYSTSITPLFKGYGLTGDVTLIANDGRSIVYKGGDGQGGGEIYIPDQYGVDTSTTSGFKYGVWYSHIKELVEYANANNCPVFIECGVPLCGPCEQFNSVVFQNKSFQDWIVSDNGQPRRIFMGKYVGGVDQGNQYTYVRDRIIPQCTGTAPQTPYLICWWPGRGVTQIRWFCVDAGGSLEGSISNSLKTVDDVEEFINQYLSGNTNV